MAINPIWDFTEQSDKWGYLNNPRWSSQADSQEFCEKIGLSLDSPEHHLPCGHWHKKDIIKYDPFPAGKWVAAQPQPDTPYIYLYDVTYKAVIKLETSIPPVIAEILPLESLYSLDHSKGRGNPGTQRGGYCMNKDGSKLWYLFSESTDDRSDCELIEIDISSTTMRIVRKTTFPNLVPSEPSPGANEVILDGCSDDTHTYWCTGVLTGRIIKIRNSDHVLVDDHLFGLPANNKQGIVTIDVEKTTQKLYWNYVANRYTFTAHYIISDTDFNIEVDVSETDIGTATPWWQNMVRIHSGYVLQHRAYHPSIGPLQKKSLADYSILNQSNMQYLQNIFGVKDGKLFTLMQVNSTEHPAYLCCLDFSDLSTIFNLDISYYAGQSQIPTYPWDWTAVSAMSEQTGIIIVVRYHNTLNINYVASFRANSSLDLLSDVPLYSIEKKGNVDKISDEPQIWRMD